MFDMGFLHYLSDMHFIFCGAENGAVDLVYARPVLYHYANP